MRSYWERIEQVLEQFWRPGDDLRCINYFVASGRRCGLCGHEPITHNYVLQNSRSGDTLTVGSNCIHQFKVAVNRISSKVTITFPKKYERLALRLNQKHPSTVFVEGVETYSTDNADVTDVDNEFDLGDDRDLLHAELASDAEDWARAGEEGWYYGEEDDRDDIADLKDDS